MTGTIVMNRNTDELIEWLSLASKFEVTKKNYEVAVGGIVSQSIKLNIRIEKLGIVCDIPNQEEYLNKIPKSIGGNARHIDFRGAINLCYQGADLKLLEVTKELVHQGEGVFLVAKDSETRDSMAVELKAEFGNESVHVVTKETPVYLKAEDESPVKVVISTFRHNTGYDVTKFRVMVTGVYLSNECSGEQLEGRLVRLSQKSEVVYMFTVHCGILTNIYEKYQEVRRLSDALKGLAKQIGVNSKELVY